MVCQVVAAPACTFRLESWTLHFANFYSCRHLDSIVAQHPDREALVVPHQNVRWSYAEMMERANRLAARFLDLGLAPGDRVGIWAPNCSEWWVCRPLALVHRA